MSNAVPVLIADDHPVVRSGIEGILEAAEFDGSARRPAAPKPSRCRCASTRRGADGPADARTGRRPRHGPDQGAAPQTQVLVLTTYGTDAHILRSIDADAVGYLVKDAPHQEIARAVHAAARGETTLAPAIAQRLNAACPLTR